MPSEYVNAKAAEPVGPGRVLGESTPPGYAIDNVADVEVWPLPASVHEVTVTGDELAALCPVTGNPDRYTFAIVHAGSSECESKALKLWLQSYRQRPLSCAALAAELADALSWRLDTPVTVSLSQSTRGGMNLSATATGKRRS